MRDQSVLDGEHDGGPTDSRGDDTDGVTGVALVATISSPFETPVDGTEEGEDLFEKREVYMSEGFLWTISERWRMKTYSSSVSDLKRLENVKGVLGGVLAEEVATTRLSSVCKLE